MPPARRTALDLSLVFLCAAALVKPLFSAGYLDTWGSIENAFISMARFRIEHWPHPQWMPLWYAGTRFDYLYPPALPYGTAVLSMLLKIELIQAYHLYTAIFYCAGIAGVYWLVWIGTRSRGSAWLAALASAIGSPSFLFLAAFRHDSPRYAPQRLHVLTVYGEGPHMTAFALLPIALAFGWLAFERKRPLFVVLASVFSAAVVANNFYGASALAVFYVLLVFSFGITRGLRAIAARALAIPILAYGLTAFWLVPSYIRLTAVNMRYVATPGSPWSLPVAGIVAAAFAVASWFLVRNREELTWAVFVAGAVVFFVLDVAGNYFFNFVVTGVPHRWVPELDLALTLAGVAILRRLWNLRSRPIGRGLVILLAAASLFSARHYIRHAWELFPPYPDYQRRIEYRISEWFSHNMPDARVKAAGSVRLWLDAWRDLAQLGGASDQGQINQVIPDASYEIDYYPKPEASLLWLQSFGVDAVYASDARSEEVYKEFRYPQKFAGILPVVFDDGQGDTIYKVPRRYPSRARVVDTARFRALAPPRDGLDVERLGAYVNVIEHGPDSPVSFKRDSPESIRLRGHVDPGQSILVQETYDPAWRAFANGKELAIHKDIMGLMAIDAPPGDQEIRLEFTTLLEYRVGWGVSIVTLLALIGLLALDTRRGS